MERERVAERSRGQASQAACLTTARKSSESLSAQLIPLPPSNANVT